MAGKTSKKQAPVPKEKDWALNVDKEVPADFDFETLKWDAIYTLGGISFSSVVSLLTVTKLERNDKIPTACIGRYNGVPTIFYNGPFVYTYANTPTEFAAIILHEVLHEVLQHLEFVPAKINTHVWNVAMDAIVNSTIALYNQCNIHKWDREKKYLHLTKVFEDLYPLEGMYALLRPRTPIRRNLRKDVTGVDEIDAMRKTIYADSDGGYGYGSKDVTERAVYDFIVNFFNVNETPLPSTIGSHGLEMDDEGSDEDSESSGGDSSEEGDEKGKGGKKKEGEEEEYKEIKAKPGDEVEGKEEEDAKDFGIEGFKKGLGNHIDETFIDEVGKDLNNSAAGRGGTMQKLITKYNKVRSSHLEAAVRMALMDSVKAKIISGIGAAPRASRGVVIPSTINRSDLLKMGGGYYPVFFNKTLPDVKKSKCFIYIDVSGSVQSYLSWIYGVVLDLDRVAEISPYLFSTTVHKTTMKALSEGKLVTDGGTCFDCIAESILGEKEIEKAVIFTDGYANLAPRYIRQLKEKHISIVGAVFPCYGSANKSELEKFCDKVVDIPKIES